MKFEEKYKRYPSADSEIYIEVDKEINISDDVKTQLDSILADWKKIDKKQRSGIRVRFSKAEDEEAEENDAGKEGEGSGNKESKHDYLIRLGSKKYRKLYKDLNSNELPKIKDWILKICFAEEVCGKLEKEFHQIRIFNNDSGVVIAAPAGVLSGEFTLCLIAKELKDIVTIKDNVTGRVFGSDGYFGKTPDDIMKLLRIVMGLKKDDYMVIRKAGESVKYYYDDDPVSLLKTMDEEGKYHKTVGKSDTLVSEIHPYELFKHSKDKSVKMERSLFNAIRRAQSKAQENNKVLTLLPCECKCIKDAKEIQNVKRSLRYIDEINNSVISFDEKNAIKISNIKKEGFQKKISDTIKTTLKRIGETAEEISIDHRGVIRYTLKETDQKRPGVGYIGQVFRPDKSGLVETQFYTQKDNYRFVPGYFAVIDAHEKGSFEERTYLTGYEQMICEAIRLQIIRDMYCIYDYRSGEQYGYETSINNLYRHLNEDRFDYDFLAEDTGNKNNLELGIRKAIIETLNRKVRYASWLGDICGVNQIINNVENRYTGTQSISLIGKTSDGIFDPEATATGKKQGLVRYLAEGVSVDINGKITKSNVKGDRTPIFKDEFLKQYSRFNPFDRNQMVFSNLMRAYRISDSVKTMMMACGGWNFDDGFVVTKEFAENNQVPVNTENHTGRKIELRPLKIGDKMLDRGGNKGVISLIVDTEKEPDPKEVLLHKAWELFKKYDGLQVIEAPYSGLSRFNGATGRELIDNDGKARFIITQQFADKKTNVYDEDDYEEGSSRKASSQLSWALASKDAVNMLKEFYSYKSESHIKDLRILLDSIQTESIPGLTYDKTEKDITAGTKPKELEELWTSDDYLNVSLFDLYKIPVIPVHLREGIELDNGRAVDNELTKQYKKLVELTHRYFKKSNSLQPDKRKELKDRILKQRERINQTIVDLYFSGKENFIKTGIMSRPLPYSATAVWTADPRLGIGEIAISSKIAKGLDVKKSDVENGKAWLLIWRDPILRDAGVRYMKVTRVDKELEGIAINPVCDKCFDGDFDGDTVAVVRLQTKEAREEAIEKFSFAGNLLDLGKTKGTDRVFINHGLDLIIAESEKPGLKKKYEKISEEINGFEPEYSKENTAPDEELNKRRRKAVERLNEYVREAFEYSAGKAVISCEDETTHIDSLEKIRSSGAKKGDLDNYIRYLNNAENSETPLPDSERIKVQKATAVKAAVGVAGRYSQQLMRAFRNECPKAVLELTYPNTQALLQAKHDPERAVKVYKILQDSLMLALNKDLRKYLSKDESGELKKLANEAKKAKLKEWNSNLTVRWNKLKPDEKEERLNKRKKRLIKIYKELGQPIGVGGIKEEYLNQICAELDYRSLEDCHGSILDECAYGNPKNAKQVFKLMKNAMGDKNTDKISFEELFKGRYTDFLVMNHECQNDNQGI